jgi:hypothetical protein
LRSIRILLLTAAVLIPRTSPGEATDVDDRDRGAFLQRHCLGCHAGDEPEAGLDLQSLRFDPADPGNYRRWVRVYGHVKAGKMPPADEPRPDGSVRERFLTALGSSLRQADARRQAMVGRVQARRLTRSQYERTIHDLLGIDIPLKDFLPEDPRSDGFDTVAEAQQVSHFLLEKFLDAADAAIDATVKKALNPPAKYSTTLAGKPLARADRGNRREPELRAHDVAVWSTGQFYHGRMPATSVPESGWYRVRLRVSAINPPRDGGVWCSVRSGAQVAAEPIQHWMGSFEATPEPKEVEFEAWIRRGHRLEVRPNDETLPKAKFSEVVRVDGKAEAQGIAGVAIHWIRIDRIDRGAPPGDVRSALFGDLSAEELAEIPPPASRRASVARLVGAFATRAFRRPVSEAEASPYVTLAYTEMDAGASTLEALRGAYRGILCSPRFLYFEEPVGALDGYALATRLSYFLWGTMPDGELLGLAACGRLKEPAVVQRQVERLLDDPRARAFTEDFCTQWLNLSEIDSTVPDRQLYPEFDEVLKHSMVEESLTFFDELLRHDLGVANVVHSDFTMLDGRLAKHYGIPGVVGEMRRVPLASDSKRGGFLTQGSVLKVTANGTTTSPVIRGAWVLEHILGERVPPPPANVPAVEPDIRGAKTIREQLARHRDNPSCVSCHVQIDPPGFALENYDVIGGWRDRYRKVAEEKGKRWQPGPPVDASYTMADGTPFRDIDEFKRLLLDDESRIARNLASKLVTYATGAGISEADREAIDAIVDETRSGRHGLRSLVHAVTRSPAFLDK